MAISSVGTNRSGSGSGATTVAATSPGSLQVNDLLIISISLFSTTANALQSSAGWTLTNTAVCNSNQSGLYYKLATSGDVAAGSFSFSIISSASFSYIAMAFRGVNTTTPVSSVTASVNTVANSGQTIGTKTETSGNSIFFTFIASQKTTTGQFTDANQTLIIEQIGPAQPAMSTIFDNTFSGTSASITYSMTAVNNSYVALVINNGSSTPVANPLSLFLL